MFQQDRDYGDYRNQRRKEQKKIARAMQDAAEDDGMFFGASPKQKSDLRETVDKRKRGVDLSKLDLNALDRDKYNAPEKVGKSLRLIDMAMSDSGPMPALTREEAERRVAQTRRQKAVKAQAQVAARQKAQAAARQKAQAVARQKAQAAARQKAQAAARQKAQAAAKAKTKLTKRFPAPKTSAPKGTKHGTKRGMKLEDMGLKATPRRVRPSGRIKRGGPRR